jgi:hypothetical protein
MRSHPVIGVTSAEQSAAVRDPVRRWSKFEAGAVREHTHRHTRNKASMRDLELEGGIVAIFELHKHVLGDDLKLPALAVGRLRDRGSFAWPPATPLTFFIAQSWAHATASFGFE